MTAENATHIGADNSQFVPDATLAASFEAICGSRAIEQADAVVLAGGRSSRMGSDKALLALGGMTLIEHAIALSRRAGLPTSIAGSRPDLGNLGTVLADAELPEGPLTGVCSALNALAKPWVVVLTVDMPLVPPALIALMLNVAIDGDAAVVIPSFAGVPHPFPCVLQRGLLDGLRLEYSAGRRGCLHAFVGAAKYFGKPVEVIRLESLVKSDLHPVPIELWLLNVNRPEDLVQADQWIAVQGTGNSRRSRPR